MEKRSNKSVETKHNGTLHPGSSVEDAKAIGGKGDFGVPESNLVGRAYTSANTRQADPGGGVAHAGSDGNRTSGAGGNSSGDGSSSGGDIDTDVIGIGNGRGLAASGRVHEPAGPDDSTGGSRDFASGPPAKGKNAPVRPRLKAGSFVQHDDANTTAAQGADATPNTEIGSDAFVGEVSTDEASGRNDAGD